MYPPTLYEARVFDKPKGYRMLHMRYRAFILVAIIKLTRGFLVLHWLHYVAHTYAVTPIVSALKSS